MHWQYKAKIMKACALFPAGGQIYRLIQKTFGRLKADPMSRIPAQVEMARWILERGKEVEGKRFFEVGTGHCPIIPLGFFLCGAGQVITVDLNRRLDLGILKKSLVWMAENRDTLAPYYGELTASAAFDKRMNLIDSLKNKPEKLLSEANILYLAPADASNTGLPDASVDYHVSNTVFEHILREDIELILTEDRRILRSEGASIHFIDLSDHFQHQDPSITRINFLGYSDEQWLRIAGNEFAYCNRLRATDFLHMFSEVPLKIIRNESEIDDESKISIKNGFQVDERFSSYSLDDLCTTSLRTMLINEHR